MSSEVQSIVKEFGLEQARIQVGRERIYPPREGLTVSPQAIEQLKAALSSPDAVKGTVKITEGETTKFWVSKGVVNVPLNPQIEEQGKTVKPALKAAEPERGPTQKEQEKAAAREPVAAPPAVPKEYDFPTDALNHTAPVQGFANTVQTQIDTAQATALQAKANRELAQKNLATFAKTVKHRGFKAWAKDQMPILKEKALELAAQQGTKLKDWAKEQAPVAKEAVIKTAHQVGQQAVETGVVVGAVAAAVGRVVADAAVEKGKELGAKAWEKFENATQLVDPVTLDPALKTLVALYGKDGFFAGGEVDYRTESGRVNVYQKDGTPVYVEGKLNPKVDGRFADRLNRVSGNLKQIQAEILKPSPVEQKLIPHQPPREKAKGFGR